MICPLPPAPCAPLPPNSPPTLLPALQATLLPQHFCCFPFARIAPRTSRLPPSFPKVCMCISCSAVSNSLRPHGLQRARLLCPWDSPGKNTGVGCHFLLQGIFPIQGLNLGLLHCRRILYHLSIFPLDVYTNTAFPGAFPLSAYLKFQFPMLSILLPISPLSSIHRHLTCYFCLFHP